jgi:hypothetical protein
MTNSFWKNLVVGLTAATLAMLVIRAVPAEPQPVIHLDNQICWTHGAPAGNPLANPIICYFVFSEAGRKVCDLDWIIPLDSDFKTHKIPCKKGNNES